MTDDELVRAALDRNIDVMFSGINVMLNGGALAAGPIMAVYDRRQRVLLRDSRSGAMWCSPVIRLSDAHRFELMAKVAARD